MKIRTLLLAVMGVSVYSGLAFADICKCKPEAESVKNPLPVKYQKLKEENTRLKNRLAACMETKEKIKSEISRLESQISQLTTEKELLQNKLNSLPSKESLEAQIQELENRVGR